MAKTQQTTMSLFEMLGNTTEMNIGDAFAYIWKNIANLPMSLVYSTIGLYILLKIIFFALKVFGVIGANQTQEKK
jgi:hypothetical protein